MTNAYHLWQQEHDCYFDIDPDADEPWCRCGDRRSTPGRHVALFIVRALALIALLYVVALVVRVVAS